MARPPSRTSRTHRRAVALLAVIVVAVIGLAVGVVPSKSAGTTPTTAGAPAAGSSALGAARQSCTLFASLVSDLQAGKLTPEALGPRVAAVDQAASAAAGADRAAFAKLASDARALDVAVGSNDPTTGTAAQALATDCQAVLSPATAKT